MSGAHPLLIQFSVIFWLKRIPLPIESDKKMAKLLALLVGLAAVAFAPAGGCISTSGKCSTLGNLHFRNKTKSSNFDSIQKSSSYLPCLAVAEARRVTPTWSGCAFYPNPALLVCTMRTVSGSRRYFYRPLYGYWVPVGSGGCLAQVCFLTFCNLWQKSNFPPSPPRSLFRVGGRTLKSGSCAYCFTPYMNRGGARYSCFTFTSPQSSKNHKMIRTCAFLLLGVTVAVDIGKNSGVIAIIFAALATNRYRKYDSLAARNVGLSQSVQLPSHIDWEKTLACVRYF